eukprot:GHVN01087852.1.p1 GENE.GHVN01087852.1~~GHVN01087852.1.p1  ORF type:complete len:160 (+),score=5.91 GHVN01087852.1:70-549(+)
MAQVPWTIIRARETTVEDAERVLRKCSRDLSKKLDTSITRDVISRLDSLSNTLSETSSMESCLQLVKIRALVQMLPCYMGCVSSGIRAYLIPYFFRYVPEIEGVFIGYKKLKRLDDYAFLPEGGLWGSFVFDLEVETLALKPTKGSTMGQHYLYTSETC